MDAFEEPVLPLPTILLKKHAPCTESRVLCVCYPHVCSPQDVSDWDVHYAPENMDAWKEQYGWTDARNTKNNRRRRARTPATTKTGDLFRPTLLTHLGNLSGGLRFILRIILSTVKKDRCNSWRFWRLLGSCESNSQNPQSHSQKPTLIFGMAFQ